MDFYELGRKYPPTDPGGRGRPTQAALLAAMADAMQYLLARDNGGPHPKLLAERIEALRLGDYDTKPGRPA